MYWQRRIVEKRIVHKNPHDEAIWWLGRAPIIETEFSYSLVK